MEEKNKRTSYEVRRSKETILRDASQIYVIYLNRPGSGYQQPMIFKLTFENGIVEWWTAKDQFHLLKFYDAEFNLSLKELENVDQISDDDAKTIMVNNSEFDEDNPDDMPEQISLYDLAGRCEDFTMIASNEFI